MHGYKWPINCTRTRTAAPALIAPDKDGSGDITAAEIAAGLEAMHVSIPEERLEHMMLAIGA